MSKKLKKGLYFTDIHFGRKRNADWHNQDCLDFIDWVCSYVVDHNEIEFMVFMGDWFDHRDSVNISTMNYSYQAARKLNELGIPIFFCIGNHDLYKRNSRDLHSVVHFQDLNNFKLYEHPEINDDVVGGLFLCPYVFHDEYPNLKNKSKKCNVWAGHFEFKGFVLTGTNVRMPTGPDIADFTGPKHILSGHFHKRQQQSNIVYIGNTFPMDFSDCNDYDRGFAVYDHETNDIEYHNWDNCPKYLRYNVSSFLSSNVTIPPKSFVKCIIDQHLSYEELLVIKQTYMENFELREFIYEESGRSADVLANTTIDDTTADQLLESMDATSIDDMVVNMLMMIDNNQLDNNVLVDIYRSL